MTLIKLIDKDEPLKVVKIINEFSVVINAGSNLNVCKGDNFEIYIPGKEIFDPDTKESLGTLDYIKCTLQTTKIFPKMAICKNVDEKEVLSPLASLSGTATTKKRVFKKINVNYEDITGYDIPEDDLNSGVKVGDFVRKVIE